MFEGTHTALITPFQKGASGAPAGIDYTALANFVEWQLDCGISGFVVCGTTAESATLDPEEKLSVIRKVKDVSAGRVPLVVGTGSNNTRQTIEFTQAVREIGVDAALIVSPYYNKPTQEGLFQHFSTVAKEGGLPVVIYNIPGRTSIDIALDTFERLASDDRIVAVKEASGSADKLIELSARVGDRVEILAGEDSLTYFVMAAGGKGVISASSNVIPAEMLAITSSALAGDLKGSLAAQQAALPKIRALFAETNPAPAKAALQLMEKLPSDAMRLPLVSVREDTREMLRTLFA